MQLNDYSGLFGMPRTRRHGTSTHSSNSIQHSDHSTGPSTSLSAPPIAPQEHQDTPLQQTEAEPTEPQLTRGAKRNSRTWDVQIIDGEGGVKRQKMRAIDIFSLPPGEKVIIEWNRLDQPVELSGGMLAQFLGHIATNCQNFPIGYEKWQKIPEIYRAHVWDNIIKAKLEVNDNGHKAYIMKSLAKKWRDHRYHLYSSIECDPDGPREANIAKKPSEIPLDQWVAFVDYRAQPDTKVKSEQNTRNRSNQTMPHTLGSKSFARLQKEMETQLGRVVTRAELFQVSHTTSDGSFVNEEARRNHEDLVIRSQSSSENEAFNSIFGKEHPGYVRGMGLGVVPTQVYGSSSNSGSRRNDNKGTQGEVDALRAEVERLTKQAEDREQRYQRLAQENDERYQRLAQENEQRYQQFQQQLAYLNQHLPNRNQYIAPNQENVVSPVIGRRSSQDSHFARGEENSDHSA